MSKSRRDENLEWLDRKYPGIRKRVEERKEGLLRGEGIEVEEELSVEGEAILKVRAKGRELYLAGRRSPAASARNQVAALGGIMGNAPVFLVGMGNLHYLEEVLRATDESVIVIIYEPVFSIFYRQLGIADLKGTIGGRKAALIVEGINEEETKGLLRATLVKERIPLMKNLTLPNYAEFCAEKILAFYQEIDDIAKSYLTFLNTRLRFISVAADNFYHNVPYVRTGYRAGQLAGAVPNDVPAILVSAGPSLNKNIRELRRAKNHAFLIAADTAVKPLLREGIVPDMYAMLDGKKPLNLVEAEGSKKIPLVVLVNGAKAILDYHTGKKFFINEGYSYVNEMFKMNGETLEYLPVGGSVATLAFSLACHLGFKDIIFVGQDLALTGNKTHADGTFKEKMDEIDTSKYKTVPGNYEKEVPTRGDFDNYRKWFEEFIESWSKRYDVRFINATEGGAKIAGTEIMTLKEAIDGLCTKEVDIGRCFEKLEPAFSGEEQEKILRYFHDTPKEIHKMAALAEEGEKLYQRLDKQCSHGNMDRKAYLKILTRVKKNRKRIEGNPNYQLVSETIARAEQIIQSSQFFRYDSMEEEGKELARQGKLYMDLIRECAGILERIAEETVAKAK